MKIKLTQKVYIEHCQITIRKGVVMEIIQYPQEYCNAYICEYKEMAVAIPQDKCEEVKSK